MKKIIISTGLGMAMCLSSFGQGYFTFTDSGSTAVLDGFSNPGAAPVKSPANVIVGILWCADSAATIPALGTAASTAGQIGDWAAILGDSNFHLAQSGGAAITAPTRTGLSLGTFNGGVKGIDGTNPGDNIAMYVIGWAIVDGAAGYGNSAVLGWSNKFIETLGGNATPGLTLAAGMTGPFVVNAVPEPGTFALAGLGIAAMLASRRRK